MIYNVAQLLKSQVGASQDITLDELAKLDLEDESVRLIGPIRGNLRLRRTNQGLLVTGPIETEVELTCVRCLDLYRQYVTFALEEQYYPTVDVVTGVSLPKAENELIFPIDHHHQLSLDEAVRQNLLLALPMQPLCKENCAGLCPHCGNNFNHGTCNCQPDQDERFSALQALLADFPQPE